MGMTGKWPSPLSPLSLSFAYAIYGRFHNRITPFLPISTLYPAFLQPVPLLEITAIPLLSRQEQKSFSEFTSVFDKNSRVAFPGMCACVLCNESVKRIQKVNNKFNSLSIGHAVFHAQML